MRGRHGGKAGAARRNAAPDNPSGIDIMRRYLGLSFPQVIKIHGPAFHHAVTLRQMLRAVIGPSIGVAYLVGKLMLNEFIRLRSPSTSSSRVRAMARKPCGVISVTLTPIARRAYVKAFLLMGLVTTFRCIRLGKTNGVYPVSGCSSLSMLITCGASGTICGVLVFVTR